MPDNKSHIEESLRKAFEGFELPPKGEDWKTIEENMQPGSLDEQDSQLRDAFTGHTEDPLESDWLIIAAALDSADTVPAGEPIPTAVENSFKQAFDDFSMPVTGRDWRIIATKLSLDGSYSFLSWRILLPLLLLIGVLGIGSYALWDDSNNPRKAIAEISHQKAQDKLDAVPSDDNKDALQGKSVTVGDATSADIQTGNGAETAGNAGRTPSTNSGNSTESNGNNGNTGGPTATAGNGNPTQGSPIKPNNITGGNTTGGTATGATNSGGSTSGGSASGGTATSGTNGASTAELPVLTEANFTDYRNIQGTGLKTAAPAIAADISGINPSALAVLEMKDIKVKAPIEAIPAFKREIYAAVQVNRDPGYMVGQIDPAVQHTPGVLSAKAPSINLRLETGLSFKMNNWRLGGGIGFEQTVASQGTYKIRIPGNFLPYHKAGSNDTIYLFPRTWRDSVIHINNGPSTSWIEIPLAIERSFNISHNLRFRMGLTLNPGLMAGSGGQMANPYMSEDSTKWQYIAHKTVSNNMVVNASDMLNKSRIGSGLQIGLSKETARYDWGIQLQGRYYFNNAFKPGVPATQHNKSYGVQIKFAFKI